MFFGRPHRYCHCLLAGCIALILAGGPAGSVFGQLSFFSRKPKSNEIATLTEKSGPWLVMVTSFSGEDGEQRAIRLANELSGSHRFKTYVYKHHFQFDIESRGKGYQVLELPGNQKTTIPKSMKANRVTDFEEVAVLIGDFSSVDDPKAQKTLEFIKNLRPESLANQEINDEVLDGENLAGERLAAYRMWADWKTTGQFRPLRSAFVLANPLLPDEYFAARFMDSALIKDNVGLKYSLLNCPGTYSVKVATFTGRGTMDPVEIERIKEEEMSKRRKRQSVTESKLVNAAKRATLLTAELRRQGFEAYEFHDEFESYVCVGSFDWVADEDERGRTQTNPEVEKTILTFMGQDIRSNVDHQRNSASLTGKTFPLPAKFVEAGVVCDVQPLPVLVPKPEKVRTVSRILNRFR